MGVIRGIFLVLVSVLLFLSLFSATLFGIFGNSLIYNNFEASSLNTAKEILVEYNLSSQVEKIYPAIQIYCKTNSNYLFTLTNYTFNISCDTALQGTNAIIEEGTKDFIHQIYYTNYNCSFLDCFKNSEIPLFLVSEKAYSFWMDNLYLFSAISFILFVGLFLLVKKKANAFIILGALFMIPSILLIKIDSLFSLFSNETISKFLNIFFSQSFNIALKTLVIGIVLLILGIIFKIFKIGFFISDLISKLKKKQEIKEPLKSKKSIKTIKAPIKIKSK